MRRLCAFAILVVGLTSAAQAQVKIVHDPAYLAGQVIRSRAEVTSDQTLTIAGMNVETKAESFFTTRETVGERNSEGKLAVAGEFESFVSNISTPVGNIAFDSANPDKSTDSPFLKPVEDLFRAMAKAKWTSLIAKDHKVESIKYEGDPFAGLDDAVKQEVDPERTKRGVNIELARMPDKAVSPGESWKRTENSEIGGGQTMLFEKEYTYIGPEQVGGRTFDKIGVKHLKCRYSMSGANGPPFKVDDADLAVAETAGTLLYDRERKAVTSSMEKVRLKGDLKFKVDVNGQEMELAGGVDLTITSKGSIE